MALPSGQQYRAGLTLLELAIVLAAIGVLFLIALPTLQESDEEASVSYAKQQLEYLYAQEQLYYNMHGTYAPFSVMAAKDSGLQATYDTRYKADVCVVEGIKFIGPSSEQDFFEIVAELPDGTRYKVDQTGEVVPVGQ